MSNVIGEYIKNLLQAGMELEVILYALDETAWAKRPSPHYMRAILQRLRGEGILTGEQLRHHLREREEQRQRDRNRWEDDLPF